MSDLIDRAEAIRIASGYCHWSNIAKELEKLPSVTPTERTGHWTRSNVPNSTFSMCTECGFNRGELYFNFCPACGADMRGNADAKDNTDS